MPDTDTPQIPRDYGEQAAVSALEAPDEQELPLVASTDEAVPEQPAVEVGEIMDTHEQLAVLLGAEQGTRPEPDQIRDNLLAEDRPVFSNIEVPIEVARPEAFKAFAESQSAIETVPNIKLIVAEAEERTPEETFAQLSLYLAEADEKDDTREVQVIRHALDQLAELLPLTAEAAAIQDKEEVKLTITPELTEKLLVLFKAAGYENPGQTLVDFVRRNSFEFLIQAIQYLYQMSHDDNRQEIAGPVLALQIPEPSKPLTARLGQIIVALTARPAWHTSV